ncbi:MAG: hypothetical protein WDN28_31205 [Chthoniobacter sp.]
MLSSFACAIPGIMATRTIENRKDRLVTILVAPLMSCSARVPVYTIMIAVLLPGNSAWQKALIMLSMYFLGAVVAFGMAWLFKKKLLKGETPMLLLEMPPYRMPSWRGVALRMWERSGLFLRRAGTVIPRPFHSAVGDGDLSQAVRSAGDEIRGARAKCRGPHGPCDRTADRSARLRLEDRHRPHWQLRGCARSSSARCPSSIASKAKTKRTSPRCGIR